MSGYTTTVETLKRQAFEQAQRLTDKEGKPHYVIACEYGTLGTSFEVVPCCDLEHSLERLKNSPIGYSDVRVAGSCRLHFEMHLFQLTLSDGPYEQIVLIVAGSPSEASKVADASSDTIDWALNGFMTDLHVAANGPARIVSIYPTGE